MPYPIDKKLVIAVASSALFDLTESDEVFRSKGKEAYKQYQIKHLDNVLQPGVAFPFIKRLLSLNTAFPEQEPVEVILLSRNSPETGLRVFRSINHHALNISRAGFLNGGSPFRYIPAFNAALFLSANETDVQKAVAKGFPAGVVLQSDYKDDAQDLELRVAFDFDGVLADDQAEQIYQKNNDLTEFHQAEELQASTPHNAGPLADLFQKISVFQKMEIKRESEDPNYQRILKTAIVTARNAPSHERMITTLRKWGVETDETFFLGGIEKKRVLEIMQPHIFFDDQLTHLESAAGKIPSVHVPFGKLNTNYHLNSQN